MAIYKFEDFAINCTEKKMPSKEDYATYIGLEHMDTKNIHITRWGSDVPIIGEKLVMHKGDILFGKRNTYLRRAAIAPHDGIFSAHGMILRPKTDIVDYDFFVLFIASDYFFDKAIQISVGSLSPTVNWKDLKDLEFNLPDMDTQKEIANVLWSINDTLDSYKEQLRLCDELVKAQFLEMFGNGLNDYKNYQKVRLLDIFEKVTGGEWGADCNDEKGIPILRTTNFTDIGKVNFRDVAFRKIDTKKVKDKFLKYGDILIEKSGGSTDRPVGRVVFFDGEEEMYLYNNFTAKLRLNNNYLFNNIFVFASLFVNYSFGGTKEFESKTTGIHNLHLSDYLSSTYICIPPIDLQNKFVDYVKHLDKSKFAIQNSIDSLNKIYTSIINKNLG